MSEIDERLIQYCKDNDFPIEEMGEDYFKVIDGTLGYQRYLLACKIIELNREIARPLYKLLNYIISKLDDLLK